MSPSSAQAPCRLSARRRLALGGLVLTGALAAGAFVSTPAFADAPTPIASFSDLQDALAAHDSNLQLTQNIDANDAYGTGHWAVSSPTTLDLNGKTLWSNQVTVAAGVEFTVKDSRGAGGDASGQLGVSASGNSAANGVDLGDGATFHVMGADVSADGNDGGAGIGSDDSTRTAKFVADGGAYVYAYAGYAHTAEDEPAASGAGIGGAVGEAGIDVTVADNAQVIAQGGYGASGVGGGAGGAGGLVHVERDGRLSASQGSDLTAVPNSLASAIGAGESSETLDFGSLRIDAGAFLSFDPNSRLVIPDGGVVENAGSIDLSRRPDSADLAVLGAGTVHNLGSITAETVVPADPEQNIDGSQTPVADPSDLIASSVKVTGYNYAIQMDGTSGVSHLLSKSISDLPGYSAPPAPSGSDFWKWNTAADGSGTDVADGTDGDLAALGVSTDGTPVPAALHARFAAHPVATATSLPDGTVGTAYHAALPIAGDDLSYSVEYGGSSSSMIPGLPDGLAIDPSTGVISGTPTEAVNQDVVFYVNGPRFGDDFRYHLIVAPAPVGAPAPTAPSLPAVPNTTVKLGHDLHLVVTAKSSVPVTYSLASGTLPKGVQIDRATGVISGSPSESGFFSVVVKATSSAGTASTPVIIVVPEVKDLLSTKNAVPSVKVGASTVPLKVGGLEKGEHWTLKVDGRLVHRGTMKKAGTLSVSVHLGKALHDKVHTIVISGSRKVADAATRAATTVTITSLAAKKKLTVHEVSANGMKLIAVEKLAAGEHVVVKDGSKVIASGHASEYGIFAFPQSKAGKGTSTLTVHGAAAKRSGTLTVKNPKH